LTLPFMLIGFLFMVIVWLFEAFYTGFMYVLFQIFG
jgi:hypothetical protein